LEEGHSVDRGLEFGAGRKDIIEKFSASHRMT